MPAKLLNKQELDRISPHFLRGQYDSRKLRTTEMLVYYARARRQLQRKIENTPVKRHYLTSPSLLVHHQHLHDMRTSKQLSSRILLIFLRFLLSRPACLYTLFLFISIFAGLSRFLSFYTSAPQASFFVNSLRLLVHHSPPNLYSVFYLYFIFFYFYLSFECSLNQLIGIAIGSSRVEN